MLLFKLDDSFYRIHVSFVGLWAQVLRVSKAPDRLELDG